MLCSYLPFFFFIASYLCVFSFIRSPCPFQSSKIKKVSSVNPMVCLVSVPVSEKATPVQKRSELLSEVVPSYLPVVDVGDTLPLVPVGGSLVFCGTGCSSIGLAIGVLNCIDCIVKVYHPLVHCFPFG